MILPRYYEKISIDVIEPKDSDFKHFQKKDQLPDHFYVIFQWNRCTVKQELYDSN